MNTQQTLLQAQPWLLTHKENERDYGWTIYKGGVWPLDCLSFSEDKLTREDLIWEPWSDNWWTPEKYAYKLKNKLIILGDAEWKIEILDSHNLVINYLDTLYHYIPLPPADKSIEEVEKLLTSHIWEELSENVDVQKGVSNFTIFLSEKALTPMDGLGFKVMINSSYDQTLMLGLSDPLWDSRTTGWKLRKIGDAIVFKGCLLTGDPGVINLYPNFRIRFADDSILILAGEVEGRFRIKQ